MKKMTMMIITLLTISNTVLANEIKCDLTTNLEQEELIHEATVSGHGSANFFELTAFTGMVASANEYLVVSITHKESGRTSTFHGVIPEGAYLGGNTIEGDDYLQINCKK